jgi:hypothetical protein
MGWEKWLLSMKGRTLEVWKVAKIFGVLGSSIVTVEYFLFVSMYGPL